MGDTFFNATIKTGYNLKTNVSYLLAENTLVYSSLFEKNIWKLFPFSASEKVISLNSLHFPLFYANDWKAKYSTTDNWVGPLAFNAIIFSWDAL